IFAARQIKADFRLSGPLANPEVKGRFESKNGFLTKLGNYDSMNVNLNGNAKFLTIHESRIYRGKGSFTVDGEINFEKKNIFEDIKVTAKSGILVWSGWEVSREKAGHEVRLGRDIGEDFRINFKTYLDEKTNSYHTGEHEVELEYMLSNEKSFKMRMKEDENFLGLEHKIKF
ncbi:MAG: hypothetical protein U9R31_01340, partial [Candidatus Omnitrophota bacterium]|nr:hypothetical protein [Candidatus Omnitrophota bacterium]